MSGSILKKFSHALISFTLVFTTSLTNADDTEIYFSSGSSTGNVNEAIRPNILFMLDTSGSMSTTASGECCKDRMEVLIEAMTTILNDLQDVNAGLMRFTSGEGGPVLFPITYIDESVANVPGESLTDKEAYITAGDNDAEEVTVYTSGPNGLNTVSTVSTVLNFFDDGTLAVGSDDDRANNRYDDGEEDINDGDMDTNEDRLHIDSNHFNAIQFDNMGIPKGAEITSAVLYLRERGSNSGSASFRIRAQDIDDAPPLSNSDDDISSRTQTTAYVDWTNVGTGTHNYSPDLKTVIQELVCRGAAVTTQCPNGDAGNWASDDLMLIITRLTGTRTFRTHEAGTTSRKPKLTVSWVDGSAASIETTVGLRYENIRIPQGATITDASLTFTPSADSATGNRPTWKISGEKTGNNGADESAPFDSNDNDITHRLTGGAQHPASTATTAFTNWQVPNTWEDDDPVTTSDADSTNNDLKDVLQELVNQTGWCGGDPITFIIEKGVAGDQKLAHSYEGTGDAPQLSYSFDTSGAAGCFAAEETAQVSVEGDDSEQNGTVNNISDGVLSLGVDTVGVRFQGIDVPKDATISSATLTFTASGTSTGAASFTIKAQDVDDAPIFSNTNNDISDRAVTTGITWVPDDWAVNQGTDVTSDLATIVQAVVGRSGWVSGNDMAFIIEPGTGARNALSNNADPARAPRLEIVYEDDVTAGFKTARERMLELVAELYHSGGTPITEQLYESALYWRGQDVKYGLSRQNHRYSRLSHPGSYCTSIGNCRGANVNGGGSTPTDGYGVYTPSNCNTSTLSTDNCKGRAIEGSPTYISPFSSTLTCQNNYQVLLTDGSATVSGSTVRDNIATMTGTSCIANNSSLPNKDSSITYSNDEKCGVDLVKYLKENDQSTATLGENLDEDQTVTTYSIAFDLGSAHEVQYLKDIAEAGGGDYATANSVAGLVDTFTSILTDVKSDPTSFVSPSLATNAFNRLLSRDEVYFGLFNPALDVAWRGNVKKYRICVDSDDGCTLGEILDANDDAAIDSSNDKFKDTAKSVWSTVTDGKSTTEGGSGSLITDYTNTILYTEVNDSGTASSSTSTGTSVGTSLATAGFKLIGDGADWKDADHDVMRAAVCAVVSTTDNSDCHDRMHWMLGKLITADGDNPTTDVSPTQRWSTNDVLHSSPAVITYGGEDDDNDGTASEAEDSDGVISTFYDKIVFGTNDGFLHMVNGFDGKEDWRFLPNAFMTQQQSMFTNAEGTHQYGLDLTPTIYTVDHDGDGVIETADSDFVHLYIGTRRGVGNVGGKLIYALNLTDNITSKTDTLTPKFMWKIQGGVTSGYSRLGYTFSQPRLATIATTTGSKTVLIFGGGYDPTLDDEDYYTVADNGGSDYLGNAIYIVDPGDGSVILSVSGSSSGATIQVPDMHYSIPSRITTADSTGDGLTDRLYVGDTGGQIWRVDLGSDIQFSGGLTGTCTGTCTTTVVGRLAALSTSGTDITQRRFFEPPSVVQVRDTTYSNQSDYDYVLIGSGFRAHPLNEDVNDRFYALRDYYINHLEDDDGDHIAESADDYADGSGGPIVDTGGTNLIDLTNQVLADADIDDVKASEGWFYDFTTAGQTGEKILSAATTVAGGVVFTTFRPGETLGATECEGSLGNATAYNFDILSGNAFLNWDGTGGLTKGDRTLSLGGGIPSDVVPIFTEEGVVGIVGIEGGASQLGVLSGLPRYRTYYYEDT